MAENNHPKEMEMREAFGRTLVDMGREEARIVVLDADLNTSSKTVLFKKAFPDRFFQIGIAEQNLFGVAAGLALEDTSRSLPRLPPLQPAGHWTRLRSRSVTQV